MPREISAGLRRALDQPETGEALLIFVSITHPELSVTIRAVSDAVDYVWRGETWYGIPFEIELVSDDDRPPSARIAMQNVDRRIGEAVRGLATPPRLTLDVVAASEFDETASPRVPLSGEPEAEYTAAKLFLADVRGDAGFIEGQMTGWNYVQEIWPGIRATQNRLPGLFR